MNDFVCKFNLIRQCCFINTEFVFTLNLNKRAENRVFELPKTLSTQSVMYGKCIALI